MAIGFNEDYNFSNIAAFAEDWLCIIYNIILTKIYKIALNVLYIQSKRQFEQTENLKHSNALKN